MNIQPNASLLHQAIAELSIRLDDLGSRHNLLAMQSQWHENALLEILKELDPQFEENYARAVFKQQCITAMMGKESALNDVPLEHVLAVRELNQKAINDLQAEAQKKGWLCSFHEAEREVAGILEAESGVKEQP